MDIELTNDAKRSLAILYRGYKNRRKAGVPKSSAVYFSGTSEDSINITKAVSEDKYELKAAGLISCDIVGGITLKDAAIVYMESKTISTVKEWLSFGAQFIP